MRQREGDVAGALQSFETAVARAPKRADLLIVLGDARGWARDREGAIDAYRQAIAVAPDLAEARTRMFVELQ